MKYIILNKEQANKVKGEYGQYSALDPILIKTGEYILPINVINDNEFAKVREFLQGLIQREVGEDEFIKQAIQQ